MAIRIPKPRPATVKPTAVARPPAPVKTPSAKPAQPNNTIRNTAILGGAGLAIPALSAILPSLTATAQTAILAEQIPQTIEAVGDAVSGVVGSNPLFALALAGSVGYAVYRVL